VKKIGLLLAVCVVVAIGVLLITHYYKHTTGDIISKKSGPLKVDLPEVTKNGQPEEAALLDEELSASLDSKLASDASKALYDVELSKMKESIQQINKDFKDVEFQEVPQDFRLKMLPSQDLVSNGRMIWYYTDEADNLILVDGKLRVMDLGEFTSSIAYDGEGSFKQTLLFKDKTNFYHKTFKHSEETFETMTYQWKEDGSVAYVPAPEDKVYWTIVPKLDLFHDKQLSKGDVVSTVLDGYDATVTVLGYAEIAGHKTVAFERRIPDCSDWKKQGLPPYKRESVRRVYLDIETKMPLRVESRAVCYFTEEHKNNPKLPGVPESGIQQSVIIWQNDL